MRLSTKKISNMEIKDLKQPYRRMAQYLVSAYYIKQTHQGLLNFFIDDSVMDLFCKEIEKGAHPPITEEIKKFFPDDFDFSGEVETKPVMQLLDLETQKQIYTQLAKEGKFDELPDTCEFSEPVDLEVWDGEDNHISRKIIGKFKTRFVDSYYCFWKNAQLPTQKIDFSEFKVGDVVEVEFTHNETRIGWFDYLLPKHLVIKVLKRQGNQVGSNAGSKMLDLEKIKSITKLK